MLKLTKRFLQGSLRVQARAFGTEKQQSVREQLLAHKTEYCNVPDKIIDLAERKLYLNPKHPLGILTKKLGDFFSNPDIYKSDLQEKYKHPYTVTRTLSPIVTIQSNFDELLVPADHVSRKKSENYYISETHMLRAHSSAHQNEFIRKGEKAFINIADVYRRDTIDATHYPCFHQVTFLSNEVISHIKKFVDGRCENIHRRGKGN